MQDYDRMLEVIRHLIRTHQYNGQVFLLLPAALGSGIKPADAFSNLNLQKFLLREIKMWDSAASGDPRLRWNQRAGRWVLPMTAAGAAGAAGGSKSVEDADVSVATPGQDGEPTDAKPTMRSPALYAIYGEALLIAKSYQSAACEGPFWDDRDLPWFLLRWQFLLLIVRDVFMFYADYLLRAFEANPYDPLVALLLAQAYFGRAMNRQSDNRHHQIITVRFLPPPRRIHVGLSGS
jgi:general transcription factor 3C polypeptide 3 (transcription factor C subunit 4)